MANASMFQFIVLLPVCLAIRNAHAATNRDDVYALNILFTAITLPTAPEDVLQGWSATGGDPCAENWKGVTCSEANVTELILQGLNMTGGLGYALDRLASLQVLDVSDNHLVGTLPFQLPPNVQQLLLAKNNFSGDLPYSLIYLRKLDALNVSENQLSGIIPDIFHQSSTLTRLDLSFNNFSGQLPESFGDLASLSTLQVQNNQLMGSIEVLANLSLKDLDVSNNNFSGSIPSSMASISSFRYTGNNFNLTSGPFFPKSPPNLAPPSGHGSNISDDKWFEPVPVESKRHVERGHIAGIITAGVLMAVLAILIMVFLAYQTGCRDNPTPLGNVKLKCFGKLSPKPEPEVATLQRYATIKCLNSKENNGVGDVLCKNMKNCISATCYLFGELQAATNNFSQEHLIGEGASARVYRAKLSNAKTLAIKKLDSSMVMVHEKDFLEVVMAISRLRHANVTELVGYCSDHGHCILVYEYISNGTLHEVLHFAEEKSSQLPWNQRVKIALGAARALEYLHEICEPPIVHRNFKSSNILLDEDFNAHLSDCGLIPLMSFGSQCQFSAQHMGSFGYSAPEFATSGTFSVKSDVYTFGVVMLELLTGRKPLDSSRPRAEQSLVRWATPQLHDIDALSKMVDPALNGIYPAKSLSRFADVIAQCIQPDLEFRPQMSEITQSLVKLLQRVSVHKCRSGDELGSSQRILERQDFGEL